MNDYLSASRRIKKVINVIGRDKARIQIIERAIGSLDAKRRHDAEPWPPWPRNKAEKLIARSFGAALAKLEERLRRTEHRRDRDAARELAVLERALYGEQTVFLEWKAQLAHWRERLEVFSGKALVNDGALFSDSPTTWPLNQAKSSHEKSRWKREAVATAAMILDAHGLRVTATQKSATRKESLFCKVAAIISGDQKIYHQCRKFVEARNRVSK